ncbi:MAG: hypothetical protein ACYC3I_27275 [Gemmataceae bacterium]
MRYVMSVLGPTRFSTRGMEMRETSLCPEQNGTIPFTEHHDEQSHVATDINDAVGTEGPSSPADTRSSADYPPAESEHDLNELKWDEESHPGDNYRALGQRLAATGDLYRRPVYAGGLLLAQANPNSEPIIIDTARDLSALLVDRVRVRVQKAGKTRGTSIPSRHLSVMLASEAFLQQFRPIDEIVRVAHYLTDFSLLAPGYNDGGPGQRILYVGSPAKIERSMELINAFLDAMAFDTNADRTNAAALALTVPLRHSWPGAKPVAIVTSTKSHGGKDTIISFAAGRTPKVSIDYQRADWAFRQSLVAALKSCPDAGVLTVENARPERGEQYIASATLERLLTDPEPLVHSSKMRNAIRLRKSMVMTISTNYGTVSEDLLNRGLPIHPALKGNVADRITAIGNPKHDYLPRNQERIWGELLGMIERWKEAGQPLDDDVRHPFTDWARTIGGILRVNGFQDFLGNYSQHKTVDDPLRRGLGLLGAARPGEWLRPEAWANLAVKIGVTKLVIPVQDRDTDRGRERGIGVVLSAHEDETFAVATDEVVLNLKLEKKRKRFEKGGEPSTRYRFLCLSRQAVPEDPEDEETSLEVQEEQ